MTAEESVILSRILARFRRPWLAALFLGVVVVESSLLLVLVVGNFASSARYGGFQYGCPTLQATPVSTNSSVRWTRLGCPNGPALVLSHSMFDCATRENSCTLIVPTFTPPDGLLALFTVDHASPCPDATHPSLGALTLSNGGSNSTTVTVQASSYTTPVSWYVDLNASPVFGLEHYGDFGFPSQTNYATVEIDVT